MAVTTDTIHNDYPLPVYNYRVEIGGTAVAFSEVSGLNIAYEVTTFKESPTTTTAAGPKVYHMPSQAQAIDITLKKGIVRKDSIANLYGWLQTVQANVIEKRDIVVRLCDEKGEAVMSWTVVNAFPTGVDAPSFDANSNDVAIETMKLRADKVTIAEN